MQKYFDGHEERYQAALDFLADAARCESANWMVGAIRATADVYDRTVLTVESDLRSRLAEAA